MVDVPVQDVDPVTPAELRITPADRVATAGSCFAQHIAARLSASGYNFYTPEMAHPLVPPDIAREFNYGVFSARYGNIYTVLQLLQLFDRAFGNFKPAEDVWLEPTGRFIDPFRPAIMPNGFASLAEYHADRARHFSAIRTMFATMDVFVFTLGLTECWVSRKDNAAYPICPGVSGGSFDESRHKFENHGVPHMLGNMTLFLSKLRLVNPKCRVILTVSPVPLAATYEPRSALLSTMYSKAALRVLAQTVVDSNKNVTYFPSYEIITGNYNRGCYFASDLRNILEVGVDHVMRLFFEHFTTGQAAGEAARPDLAAISRSVTTAYAEQIAEAICEEAVLDSARGD